MSTVGLDIVFAKPVHIESKELQNKSRNFHPDFKNAEINEKLKTEEFFLTELSWGKHKVRIFIQNHPLPEVILQSCSEYAFYDSSIKEHAIANNKAHALLHYLSEETPVLEQYEALTSVAIILSAENGMLVINEYAKNSCPFHWLISGSGEDQLNFLKTLPLPMLFCGIISYQIEGEIWSRTLGAQAFDLPNLAFSFTRFNKEISPLMFFSDVLNYCLHSDKKVNIGDTMDYGNYTLILRSSHENEDFLKDEESPFLVFEPH